MFSSISALSFRKKRKLLITLIIILFLFLFYRGIALHLTKSVTDRIRFHAIPVAISVLYHHHAHDYTGIRAIAMQFQGSGNLNLLIKHAKYQDTTNQDLRPYFWIADDKGFADFIMAGFLLFGAHLLSLYLIWFVILAASVTLFIISFYRNLSALTFLCCILLAINSAISALALASVFMSANAILPNLSTISSVSLYEPRFLDVLALIPVCHMILLAASRQRLKRLQHKLPLIAQTFIFIFLYHARSSLGWEIVGIFLCCLFFAAAQFIRAYKNKKVRGIKYNPIGVLLLLFFGLMSLNAYKHHTYNSQYFSAMGARTFWHNALMGLGLDQELSETYHLGISDFNVAESVIKFARESNRCNDKIKHYEAQMLMNSLGNHAVADWRGYEDCAKKLYFDIMRKHKTKVAYLYAFCKPLFSINTIRAAARHFDHPLANSLTLKENLLVEKIIAERGIGWRPFNLVNCTFLIGIFSLGISMLYRARFTFFPAISILLATSFIPSVAFYPDILTQGGMLALVPLLMYLAFAFFVHKIYLQLLILRKLNQSSLEKSQLNLSQTHSQEKMLSIVVPAFNEEKNIGTTINEIQQAAAKTLSDYEIMVVDDGSTDRTYQIAKKLSDNSGNKIKVFAQGKNLGVGAAFQLGLAHANFPQLCLIPGDNAFNITGVELLFSYCGSVPLIISYRQNMEARTLLRHLLSRIATLALQIITGKKIRDAHSLYLFPVAETRRLQVKTFGYGYHIETLSRLLANSKSFAEVPVILNPKPDASSGVMKPKTLLILGSTIIKLLMLRLLGRLHLPEFQYKKIEKIQEFQEN